MSSSHQPHWSFRFPLSPVLPLREKKRRRRSEKGKSRRRAQRHRAGRNRRPSGDEESDLPPCERKAACDQKAPPVTRELEQRRTPHHERLHHRLVPLHQTGYDSTVAPT